jgi:hypothetical protein
VQSLECYDDALNPGRRQVCGFGPGRGRGDIVLETEGDRHRDQIREKEKMRHGGGGTKDRA